MALDPAVLTKSGRLLHPIGIGTWGFGEYSLASPGTRAEIAAIQYAISAGQNHIDTAEMYAHGGAELAVGQAIKPAPREDLFVTTKLWKNHVANGTLRPAVEAMLKRLETSYIDLLYIHMPWFDAPWQEAIPQICQLIDEGVVRFLGVSNFNAERLQTALSLATKPIVANQMHYSFSHRQEVTPELQKLCRIHDIALVAYRPFESGDVFGKDAALELLAQKYQATPAKMALAWLLRQGALPIPKALQAAHIDQNIQAVSLAERLAAAGEAV